MEQLKDLKKHLIEEVKFHEEQIERHKVNKRTFKWWIDFFPHF